MKFKRTRTNNKAEGKHNCYQSAINSIKKEITLKLYDEKFIFCRKSIGIRKMSNKHLLLPFIVRDRLK